MIRQNLFIGNALSEADPVFLLKPYHQPIQSRQAQLTVVRGAQNGDVFLLGSGTTLFGRTEGRMLQDVLASRRHMTISYQNGDFVLQDLRSTNGTFLNGKSINKSVTLHHGDVIRVGETLLIFEVGDNEPAVLGYGAVPQRLADHTKDEITIQTRLLFQSMSEKV